MEHDDDDVSSAPKLGSFGLSLPPPVDIRSKKKKVEHEQKHNRLRPDIDDDDDDDDDDNNNNNHNRTNDDGVSSNNTITNISMGTHDPDPFDDNWMAGYGVGRDQQQIVVVRVMASRQ